MVMPGDNVNLEIELITPIACEEGLRFAIREGGKTVGAGVVTKILEYELGVAHGQRKESSSPSNAPFAGSATTRTTKNKRANAEKLELSKFCWRCRKHTRTTRKPSRGTLCLRQSHISRLGQ